MVTIWPVYLLVLIIFINRYFGGLYLKLIQGERFDETAADYEPTVTIVVPLFNEGRGIYETVLSLLEQDYPADKLEVTVVDDCSTDDSYKWARTAAAAAMGQWRVNLLRNPSNVGKRQSITHAVRRSTAEIIVSVDSDVILDRQAVRRLVARFTKPEIGAVGGRVYARNANQNWLTRMQAAKYFFSYEYLKNLERAFHSVMCLSGCLTAYRRSVLVELEPILQDRNVLGVPIKYGEDRFLTRQIVKAGYQTLCTLEAVCYTTVPSTLSQYFSQQLRWRRSNTIDFFGGLLHAWRLHPLVSLQYFSLFGVLLLYPLLVFNSLAEHYFWGLAAFHLLILGAFGVAYRVGTRNVPERYRVGPLALLPMAVIMPVTYLLYTPLALFTLDSSSWETRGVSKRAPVAAAKAAPVGFLPEPERA